MHRHRHPQWTVPVLVLFLSLPVAASACGRDAPASGGSPAAERPLKRAAGPSAPATGSDALAVAQRPAADGSRRLALGRSREGALRAAEEDEKESQYWEGVEFGSEQFDEMQEYITQEYIEEEVDQARGYVSAANFALSLLDPAYELLPRDYYKAHKDDPELQLTGEDRDELSLKRREYFRRQHDEVQEAWKKAGFSRQDFERIMKFAVKEGAKQKEKLTKDRLWLSAGQGFLYALDPHSSLVSRKAWEDSTKETQDASFDGIGALLTQRFEPSKTLRNRLQGKSRSLKKKDPFILVQLNEEDKLRRKTYVESPMSGQPAEKAGLWAGDEIIKVDDTSVIDLPLDKVVGMIRGKRNTVVRLTVLREGVPGEVVVDVTRAHIRVTNVEGRILENYPCLGYVKLTGFIDTSYTDLKAEIEKLNKECAEGEGMRGLVFDLRNNSGGLLSQGVKIGDMFLQKGKIVTVKNRRTSIFSFMDAGDEVYNAHKEDTFVFPLVVLVNDGAASASEIVASALQDNARAIIVGERTFGKASVQTLINPMRGKGYYIKLTIARYYSPSGRTLQVVGVKPDVAVPPEVEGKMPVGFREEDLSNHLPKIDSEYASANRELTEKLLACVEKRGIAERIFRDNPHPQIKFDFQLYRGADFLECLSDHYKEVRADSDI